MEVAKKTVKLDELSLTKGKRLLEKLVTRKDLIKDAASVTELLYELRYLPLPITKAAAYLERNEVSIPEYLRLQRNTEKDMADLLSEKHRDSLTSMNNLAEVLDSQGKYEEAEQIHRQRLAQGEMVLGGEQPDTLIKGSNSESQTPVTEPIPLVLAPRPWPSNMTPTFPLSEPPVCLTCGCVGRPMVVGSGNLNHNAGRSYYVCSSGRHHGTRWITFDDDIGIDHGNPPCYCAFTSRRSWANGGDVQFYCCPVGSCQFRLRGQSSMPLPAEVMQLKSEATNSYTFGDSEATIDSYTFGSRKFATAYSWLWLWLMKICYPPPVGYQRILFTCVCSLFTCDIIRKVLTNS
jgi:hypothetical protein